MMTAVTLGLRPISLLFSIVLARLLSPSDFGLVAMTMIIVGTANTVTNFGMHAVIVQTTKDIKKVASYSFIIVMAASSLGTILVILFVKPLAELLGGGASLVPILRWMALYITIGGLGIVPNALLTRQLKFGTLSLLTIPGEIAYAIIAIPMALKGYGVWSLVVGYLIGAIVSASFIWAVCRPWIWLRPSKPEREILGPQLSFGARVTGGSILGLLQFQGDTWYVGRFLGASDAGIYSKAYSLTTQLVDLITRGIFGSVLFPSYARIQEDRSRLSRAYLKSTNLVLLIIIPMAFGMAYIAPLMVKTLFGEKWLPMIPVWQIFSLYSLTRPISVNSSPVFLAVGQPQKNIYASLVVISMMVIFILLLAPLMGVVGVALAVAIAYVVAMVFNIYQVNTILPGTARKIFTQSLYPLAAGVAMIIGLFLLGGPVTALVGGENWLALLSLIAIGAIIYSLATYFLQRELVLELYELLIKALGIDRRWPRLVHTRPK